MKMRKKHLNYHTNKPFDYFEYSQLDGSNNRFLRKQTNTKQNTFEIPTNAPEKQKDKSNLGLFEQITDEVPF